MTENLVGLVTLLCVFVNFIMSFSVAGYNNNYVMPFYCNTKKYKKEKTFKIKQNVPKITLTTKKTKASYILCY